jgi:hypothetical protein
MSEKYKIRTPVGAQLNGSGTVQLQATLNKIYGQVCETFVVNTGPNLSYSNQSFDANPPDAVSYSADMITLIDTLKDTIAGSYNDDNFYLFLLDHCTGSDKAGIMPFNQNFGFIFVQNQSGAGLERTIAHELGHGAFGLLHTFHTYGHEAQLDSATTDNLMDYAGGFHLFKYQWDEIYNPVCYNETCFGTGTTGADVAQAIICYMLDVIHNHNNFEQKGNVDAYKFLVKSQEWSNYSVADDRKLSSLKLSADVDFASFASKPNNSYYFSSLEIDKEINESSSDYVDYFFHAASDNSDVNIKKGDKIFHFTVKADEAVAFEDYAFIEVGAKNVTWVAQNDPVMKGTGCHWCSSMTASCCKDDAAKIMTDKDKCCKDQNDNEIKCPPNNTNNQSNSENSQVSNVTNNQNTTTQNQPQLELCCPTTDEDHPFAPNKCCYNTCTHILSLTGHSPSGTNITTATLANEAANDFNTLNYASDDVFTSAKNYLNSSLLAGIPIIVGVHIDPVIQLFGNTNHATDHYVVIVGRKYDPGQKIEYYLFYDVGTSWPNIGNSADNKLNIYDDQQKISGKGARGLTYIITEVRKNKLKL